MKKFITVAIAAIVAMSFTVVPASAKYTAMKADSTRPTASKSAGKSGGKSYSKGKASKSGSRVASVKSAGRK